MRKILLVLVTFLFASPVLAEEPTPAPPMPVVAPTAAPRVLIQTTLGDITL